MKNSHTQTLQQCAAKAFDNTVNVDETERLVSAIGGGAILLTTANLRSVRGLVATLMGASLIYRGLSGHCPCYSLLGMKTNLEGTAGNTQRLAGSRERVAAASK
jgi:uncharacterized membrane protein